VDRAFIVDVLGRVRSPGAQLGMTATFSDPALPAPVPSLTAPVDDFAVVAAPDALRLEDELAVPGEYPLWVTPGIGEELWVTLRDSSSIALLDAVNRRWRTWRFPSYPHVASVDERGRAWAALTLAGAVAVVDPHLNATSRIKLGRTRELLVAAHDGDACLVVDAGRLCIWRITDDLSPVAIALPPGMRRPDFIAATWAGEWWVTDTHEPVVARRAASGDWLVLPVETPTRVVIVDDVRRLVWVTHWDAPAVSRFDLAHPGSAVVTEIPGVPYGATLGPDGRLWVALPDEEQLVALDESGVTDVVPLPSDSGPGAVSLAWLGSRLYVACAVSGRLLVFS
jgi:streptogramin lyase